MYKHCFFVILYKSKIVFYTIQFSSKYILEILFFRDIIFVWGISAVGSAPHSHCGGHGFESRILHGNGKSSRFILIFATEIILRL